MITEINQLNKILKTQQFSNITPHLVNNDESYLMVFIDKSDVPKVKTAMKYPNKDKRYKFKHKDKLNTDL